MRLCLAGLKEGSCGFGSPRLLTAVVRICKGSKDGPWAIGVRLTSTLDLPTGCDCFRPRWMFGVCVPCAVRGAADTELRKTFTPRASPRAGSCTSGPTVQPGGHRMRRAPGWDGLDCREVATPHSLVPSLVLPRCMLRTVSAVGVKFLLRGVDAFERSSPSSRTHDWKQETKSLNAPQLVGPT